jgi:toxin YoeB
MSKPVDRVAVISTKFLDDLRYWIETDRKIALRVLELISAILADPLVGIGKPEPLKFELAGCWSRRITQEHRLVYRVKIDRIEFHQAKYHYE